MENAETLLITQASIKKALNELKSTYEELERYEKRVEIMKDDIKGVYPFYKLVEDSDYGTERKVDLFDIRLSDSKSHINNVENILSDIDSNIDLVLDYKGANKTKTKSKVVESDRVVKRSTYRDDGIDMGDVALGGAVGYAIGSGGGDDCDFGD